MPYASDSEVPSYVPKGKRSKWRKIWNSVYEKTGSEERAFKAANAALKQEADEMKEKAIIQARVDALGSVLNQVGKRLSKETKKTLFEVMRKLRELMGMDDADDMMMMAEQAWSPVGAMLLQKLVTGEAT